MAGPPGFGDNCNPALYGSGTFASAITAFEAVIGRPMAVYRRYYGGLPPAAIDATLKTAVDHGCYCVVSFKPAYNPVSSTDRTRVASFLASCKAYGMQGCVTMYHEPAQEGISAAQYQALAQYYQATIRAQYPYIFCGQCDQWGVGNLANYEAYYVAGCFDGAAVDYYGTSYAAGLRMDAWAAFTDSKGLTTFGIYECGVYQAGVSQANGIAYWNYIRTFMTARLPNGVGAICHFTASPNDTVSGETLTAGNYQIAPIQALADALAPGAANTVTVTSPGTQTATTRTVVNLQLTATDSDAAQTFTWAASGLPSGLSLNTSTGVISGTPLSAGSSSVTVTATDRTAASGSATFTWTVTVPLVTNIGMLAAWKSQASHGATGSVTAPLAASRVAGGMLVTVRKTVTRAAGSALAGALIDANLYGGDEATAVARFNADTGEIIGIRVHSYPMGVIPGSASDDGAGPPPGANTVTVTNPGSQAGMVGTAVSMQLTATDSAGGQTLTWTATGLPAGLVIGSVTGRVTGTPVQAESVSVTVTATDTTGAFGRASFAWVISPASTVLVYGGGYVTAPGGSSTPGATDPVFAAWEASMGRTLRVHGIYQGATFPTSWGSVFWSGDHAIPRLTFADVEPATDGSALAAFQAFLSLVQVNAPETIFRMYHSAYSKLGTATAFKNAYNVYGPAIKAAGFRLYLSFSSGDVNTHGVDATWVPPGIAFDALMCEWLHYNYLTNGETLDAPAALADAMGVPFGFALVGCNYQTAPAPDGPPATEAQGISFWQYTRDFIAARITAGKMPAEVLLWNQAASGGVLTPGYYPANQPASWITWQQRLYDLHTKSTPGNPFIW